MNRLEALLEALKEADRHVEAMVKSAADYVGGLGAGKAILNRNEITAAILAEKGCKGDDEYLRLKSENISLKAQNDLIAGECERLEAENQRMDHENQDLRDEHRKRIDAIEMSEQALRDELNVISGELHAVSAERDSMREEVSKYLDCHARFNDAIEAYRILKKQIENPALENVLAKLRDVVWKETGSHDSTPLLLARGDWLTLGDLRRWVESEVKT